MKIYTKTSRDCQATWSGNHNITRRAFVAKMSGGNKKKLAQKSIVEIALFKLKNRKMKKFVNDEMFVSHSFKR